MASFSRLQLAAALIEYDNDDSDPTKPRRSAHDSAIFAHLRRNNVPRPRTVSRRSTDYLGVALPSETGSVLGRESVLGARESIAGGRDSVFDERRSRVSSDALRNPFGRDSTFEGILGEEDEEEGLEVDLTSWGLDALLPQDKESKSDRRKSKSDALPNPHPQFPTALQPGPRAELGRRGIHASRTMSMGNLDGLGEGGAFLDAKSTVTSLGARRHSIGTSLDFPPARQPVEQRTHRGRTASSHALIESIPATPPLHSIPFPTSESVRSVSPMPFADEGGSVMRPSSRASENILNRAHGRTYSTASMGSQMLLNEQEPNPFAVRPPSPDRASRFDPKAARARTTSHGSMGTMLTQGIMEEDTNPFTLRPPSPSRSSRFDPKVRARTMSNGSLGTQMFLDNDARSSYDGGDDAPRSRRYSRLDLMRPKVLIMPSPLQSSAPAAPALTQPRATDGFELHPEGPPLPPGAKATRRSSTTLSMIEPSPTLVASNSFTPNPRASLTLSQLTFRNTLAVDGQTDPAYADIEARLRRATADGEQVILEPDPEPSPPTPAPIIVVDPADRSKRPAGKLYGKSLIDDLEARKAEMHNKKRVFTGDERPSMMARSAMKRSSTLIDPESLKHNPQMQRMETSRSQPSLSRRNSANARTLIEFNDEIPGARNSQHLATLDTVNSGNKKSVFGVDTLWERELAKLREMEERERLEAEEEAKKQAAEEAKHGKKVKGKGRRKHKSKANKSPDANIVPESTSHLTAEITSEPRPPSPSYVLPAIERTSARRRPPPPAAGDDSGDSDSDDAPVINRRQTLTKEVEADEWVAGSSDEDGGGGRRMTGPGPRHADSNITSGAPKLVSHDDDSSDDDLPLVATIGRAARRMTQADFRAEDESDEEKPLSALLNQTKFKLPSAASIGGSLFPGTSVNNDEDEDDKPLGLRVSRIGDSFQASRSVSQEADDDKPLAFHPEQIRRQQLMMAQQQQQQLMMQAQAAQFHQSMIFGAPSMMSSGFFGPPIPPPIMMAPQLQTTPPPMQDTGKFGRVDKWRRDVAVEGEP